MFAILKDRHSAEVYEMLPELRPIEKLRRVILLTAGAGLIVLGSIFWLAVHVRTAAMFPMALALVAWGMMSVTLYIGGADTWAKGVVYWWMRPSDYAWNGEVHKAFIRAYPHWHKFRAAANPQRRAALDKYLDQLLKLAMLQKPDLSYDLDRKANSVINGLKNERPGTNLHIFYRDWEDELERQGV